MNELKSEQKNIGSGKQENIERMAILSLSLSTALSLKHIAIYARCYGSYHTVLNRPEKEFSQIALLKRGKKFEGEKALKAKAEKVVAQCKKSGVRWVTIRDEDYPESLRETYLPPLVLYYKSEDTLPRYYLADRETSYLAIVGTRKSDSFMEHFTQKVAASFVKKNGHIISGLAWGIDRFAHMGAEGKTTAVVACGVDYIYPYVNRKIYKTILETGGIILSEYPPGVKPLPHRFPQRNRIISGLSEGIFVAQAPRKSGSHITVQYGLEQGRTIYTFDPRVLSVVTEPYLGNLDLVEKGAVPVDCEEDLFNEQGWLNKSHFNHQAVQKGNNPSNEDEIKKIKGKKLKSLESLDDRLLQLLKTPKNNFEIAQVLELSPMELNRLLMYHLITGKIKELPSKKYFAV